MIKIITTCLLLFFSINCFSQDNRTELRQGKNPGNILLVQNNIIQDTVGRFGFLVRLEDYYIIDKKNNKYIIIDDLYNCWLCNAKKDSTWHIDCYIFSGVSRMNNPRYLPKFKFSSTGDILKLNRETNSFEKFEAKRSRTFQEVIKNGGY